MYRKDFSNVAANVVDASIKENTAKALETLKRDAEFWLPQVFQISFDQFIMNQQNLFNQQNMIMSNLFQDKRMNNN